MKRKDFKQTQKKGSRKRVVIRNTLLVALTAFLSVVAYAVYLQVKVSDAATLAYEEVEDRDKSTLRDEAVKPIKDNVSVLFIGVDESEMRKQGDNNSRSDALLVATLNNKDKSVKLVSIPRDSYVYVHDRGRMDKITHAHAFGGTRGTIDAVEDTLDIPIDYYVKMNFNAFIDVVDALGGIDTEVPYDHIELDENDQRTIQLIKGMQHLDGKHTLALARTRKLDNDVERGKRQQMILQAILKEATSLKSVTKYGDLIDAIGDNMKTNMTFNEMKSFLAYLNGGIPEVDMLNLEGVDDMSTGVYYWMLDEEHLDEVKYQLQRHLDVTQPSSSLTNNGSETSTSKSSANEADFDSPN